MHAIVCNMHAPNFTHFYSKETVCVYVYGLADTVYTHAVDKKLSQTQLFHN